MSEPSVAVTPYVFLSYASADREQALAIADALTALGIGVWLDRRRLIGGMSWDAAIVRAIKACTVFAVLCTPASIGSPNVMQELRLAWEEQRPTLPLRLAAVAFPDEMRYILAGRQWVEALGRPLDAWLPDLRQALSGLGLVQDAPPVTPGLATPAPPSTLPLPLTNFLGREQELADLAQLLASARLITLTGPGGTGKTRLALQAAAGQSETFRDGVFFIDLAPLRDPALVPDAVAQALAIESGPQVSQRDRVLRFIRDQHLLLVLDNYEHLLAAAEFAAALVTTAAQVSVLVTSRAPLRIPGEREYPVTPFPVPPTGATPLAVLAANPGVQLFVARATDIRPDFALTAANGPVVAAICLRLDGLPLAIELAARRVRTLPPADLYERLQRRLPLLVGGARTVPARQQRLRDTIAWSYDLLEREEQTLFRRLAVFPGGCVLELAEAVCNANRDLGPDVLDCVSSLVEKSLLRASEDDGSGPRYTMLETIREFAAGELEASAEADAVRRQLAVQVLQLARRYAGATAATWALLDRDLHNIRAVLGWCVDRAEVAVGVRLWWALRWYLAAHGSDRELDAWRQRLLALPEAALPSISRARLLAFWLLSDYAVGPPVAAAEQARVVAACEEAIALSRTMGDGPVLAEALLSRAGLDLSEGRYDTAMPRAEEALALSQAAGDVPGAVAAHSVLTIAAAACGDVASVERLVAATRTLAGAAHPLTLHGEALLAEAHGDAVQTGRLWAEYVRRAGDEWGAVSPARLLGLTHLARVLLGQGDTRAAVAACAESLTSQRALGPTQYLSPVLQLLAQLAARSGLLSASARLLASVTVATGWSATAVQATQGEIAAAVEQVRAALGDAAFTEAWAAGERLSADGALEEGLAVVAQLQQFLLTQT